MYYSVLNSSRWMNIVKSAKATNPHCPSAGISMKVSPFLCVSSVCSTIALHSDQIQPGYPAPFLFTPSIYIAVYCCGSSLSACPIPRAFFFFTLILWKKRNVSDFCLQFFSDLEDKREHVCWRRTCVFIPNKLEPGNRWVSRFMLENTFGIPSK